MSVFVGNTDREIKIIECPAATSGPDIGKIKYVYVNNSLVFNGRPFNLTLEVKGEATGNVNPGFGTAEVKLTATIRTDSGYSERVKLNHRWNTSAQFWTMISGDDWLRPGGTATGTRSSYITYTATQTTQFQCLVYDQDSGAFREVFKWIFMFNWVDLPKTDSHTAEIS